MATSGLDLAFVLALVLSCIHHSTSSVPSNPTVCEKNAYTVEAGEKKEYKMQHSKLNREILCDISTDGGGWIIFQKRNRSANTGLLFNKTWNNYRYGFGDLDTEFWMGNEYVYNLTNSNQDKYTLRVDIVDSNGVYRYADYSSFRLEDEPHHFTIRMGAHSGTLGEENPYGMFKNRGRTFSTHDRHNAANAHKHWPRWFKAGFWYDPTYGTYVTLNGNQFGRNAISQERVWWRYRARPIGDNTYYPDETRMMMRKIQVCKKGDNTVVGDRKEIQIFDPVLQKNILCDIGTRGGGWIIFQKRNDNSGLNFYREWEAFRDGFGHIEADFWLGNEALHNLTKADDYMLRLDIQHHGAKFGEWSLFKVDSEANNFRLTLGNYTGNIGERSRFDGDSFGLNLARDQMFSTYDRDNDGNTHRHCAQDFQAGFWFSMLSCTNTNLNGKHWGASNRTGVYYRANPDSRYLPTHIKMMIRKID